MRSLKNRTGMIQGGRKGLERFGLIETFRFDPWLTASSLQGDQTGSDQMDGEGLLHGYWLLDLHLQRIERSAEFFSLPFSREDILSALADVARKIISTGKTVPARTRLVLYGDGLDLSWQWLQELDLPVRFCLCTQVRSDPEELVYHKTTMRSFFDRHRQGLRGKGLFETVFLDGHGHLSEGTITNIFLRLKDEPLLLTPPLSCKVLPGVLRQHLLERKEAREELLVPDDLDRAEEIYLGNSVRGLLPAIYIRGHNGV